VTANQIVAAVVSFGIMGGLWVLGVIPQQIANMPTGLKTVLSYVSLSGHSIGFVVGILDTRDIIYLVSVTVLFLFMATRSLESGRWN